MKFKFLPFFLTIIFLTIFFVFYKSLQTSNVYTPKTNLEKNVPLFTAEIFDSNKKILKKVVGPISTNSFSAINKLIK